MSVFVIASPILNVTQCSVSFFVFLSFHMYNPNSCDHFLPISNFPVSVGIKIVSQKRLIIVQAFSLEFHTHSKTIFIHSPGKQVNHTMKLFSHFKFGKLQHQSTTCFQSSRTSRGSDNAALPYLIFSANFDKQKTKNKQQS